MKQKGLGKGLNALLSEEVLNAYEEKGIKTVSIHEIDPNFEQPRKKFSQEELNELSESIREYGVLQPLIVREKEGRYQIVAGERRYRASRLAQLTEVPVIIKELDDKETLEISLIENIQREELNIMELACGYSLLMEQFDYTQEEIANRLGKARTSITNILRLLTLTPYVQQKLRDQELTFGHARVLIAIKDIESQKETADLIIEKAMTVRESEKYVKDLLENKPHTAASEKTKPKMNPFYREVQDHLQRLLGTKVSISKGKKKGKIEIEYYTEDELERIIEIIQRD